MTTLTANSGTFSDLLEVSEQATLVATSGYVQYTTGTLVEASQGRAVWQTWPLGAVAGTMYSIGQMVVRLAGTADGATCVVTDPRTLIGADALARVEIAPEALLWASEDGELYSSGNVLEGNVASGAGGWTVSGNEIYLGPYTHSGNGGVQASANFTLHACMYSDALLTTMQPVLVTCSTSVAYDVTGVVAAMATRVDQALATPGNHMNPDDGAGGTGFSAAFGAQLQFSGANTGSVGLSDSLFGTGIPNFVVGDSQAFPVSKRQATPLADAVNNPKNCYIYHVRATGLAGLGYEQTAPEYTTTLTDLAALSMFAEIGPLTRGGFVTRAGGSTIGTTGAGTGFTQDWASGCAPVGILGVATVEKVMNVFFHGDSIPYGADATADSDSPPYNVSYAWTACQQVSTKTFPVNYIGATRSSATTQQACERARRFFDQVLVPDVIVIKPSPNDLFVTTELETFETECLDLGMWVIWMVPTLQSTTTAAWTAARTLILGKAGLPRRSVIDIAPITGNLGTDIGVWRGWPTSIFSVDGVHPGIVGHAVVREMLAAELRTLVAMAKGPL